MVLPDGGGWAPRRSLECFILRPHCPLQPALKRCNSSHCSSHAHGTPGGRCVAKSYDLVRRGQDCRRKMPFARVTSPRPLYFQHTHSLWHRVLLFLRTRVAILHPTETVDKQISAPNIVFPRWCTCMLLRCTTLFSVLEVIVLTRR